MPTTTISADTLPPAQVSTGGSTNTPVTFDLTRLPAGATITGARVHQAGTYDVSGGNGVGGPNFIYHGQLSANVMTCVFPQGLGLPFDTDANLPPTIWIGGFQQTMLAPLQADYLAGARITVYVYAVGSTFILHLTDTVCDLLVDYTLPGPSGSGAYIYPLKRRHGVSFLMFVVPFPAGYVPGQNVTTYAPQPDGKHYDIVRPRGGLLATVVSNILRVYGAGGVELTPGVAMAGVDICRVIF
jgi:hypothetical protein